MTIKTFFISFLLSIFVIYFTQFGEITLSENYDTEVALFIYLIIYSVIYYFILENYFKIIYNKCNKD